MSVLSRLDRIFKLALKASDSNGDKLNFLLEKIEAVGKRRCIGFERWFQIELMYKLSRNGISADIGVGEQGPKGPDLVIDDCLVELRCPYNSNVSWIKNGFKHTPKPDAVMFLTPYTERLAQKLQKLEKQGFNVKFCKVPSAPKWAIGYLAKT